MFLARAERLVQEFGEYDKRIYRCSMGSVVGSHFWSPHIAGVIKINVDASLALEGWVGLGAVARD